MQRIPHTRVAALAGFGLLIFAVLIGSLVYVQGVRGAYYRERSSRNALRVIPIPAPRGMILDRFGRPLATNRLSLDVALIPQDAIDMEFALTRLSQLTEQPLTQLKKNFVRHRSLPFVPAILIPDATPRQVAIVEEHRHALPGIAVIPRTRRTYPYKSVASHVLGFIGPVDRDELRTLRGYGVRMTDWVGKAGIESQYDAYLRGKAGGRVVEVDHRGRQMRVVSERNPTPGQTIALTIDVELQSLIEAEYEEHAGAAVVLEPETGEVLALASIPGYDPSIFVDADRAAAVAAVRDAGRPLLNRAISGTYPPGSIFKIVTGAAALEEHRVTPTQSFNCPGYIALGRRRVHCWKRDGHGAEFLRQALAHSCNVYFIQVGLALGPDPLSWWAEQFGLGHKSGIHMPGEQRGLVPSRAWKRQSLKAGWYDGDTANFSIGQGSLLVTPIQAARMITAIANGGWLVHPQLVQRIGEARTRQESATPLHLSAASMRVIVDGLIGVVAPGGTGHRASAPGLSVAGKTGSAQTPREGESHAWMTGYSPVDTPKVAFAVMYEYGGSGGRRPAMLVQKIAAYVQERYVDHTAAPPISEDAS